MTGRGVNPGRFFMIGLPGTELDPSTRDLIGDYGINQFILFARNVGSREQLRELTAGLRSACRKRNLDPPLISIDQEGGTVTRLPPPFTQFSDARKLAGSADPEKSLAEYARVCGRELLDIGVNMNLAPVLDVCAGGESYFMERRSLGEDPEKAGRLGSLIITTFQEQGIAACAKHFPGLGAAKTDPHHHLPTVNRPLDGILAVDLVPFRAAIRAGVAAIMTSHTIYSHLDPAFPATLSSRILTDLLRGDLQYNGLVITDDLEMGAIENEGLVEKAACDAFVAGADILLICEDHQKVARSIAAMDDACEQGMISRERLMQSESRLTLIQKRYALVR